MSFDGLDSPRLNGFHRKITLLSAAGTFLDGFDLTVIAVALPFLIKQWAIAPGLTGLVASSAVIGMFLGSLVLGHLTDRVGRKAMYLLDLVCFVVFAALTAISQNVWEFIAFRFLLGLGIGADYAISPTLLAEFVPAKHRGAFITAIGSCWFLGAVVAYLAGYLLLPLGPDAWRWMLALGAVIAAVVIVFRAAIPESPRWLATQGRQTEAGQILLTLTGETPHVTASAKLPWVSMFQGKLLRLTLFVAGFWFCYDIAFYGISIYTPTILKTFTHGQTSIAYLGAAAVAGLGLLGALIGMALVDHWGRRNLIILAFAGLTVMLLGLAIQPHPAFAVLIILFGLSTLFANMGPGVLDFVYPTEIFPAGVRAGATGFGTAVSRVGAILTIIVFPALVHNWGLQNALWLFVAAAVAGLGICIAMAPETKGQTLEALAPQEDEPAVAGQLAET